MRANRVTRSITAPITNIRNGICKIVSGNGLKFGMSSVLTDTFTISYY